MTSFCPFFCKEYKILKKYTRVIDSIEIKFYIVKVSYYFFGSLFCYSIKKLKIGFNEKLIPEEDYYRISMKAKAMGFEILSQNWELMTKPIEEPEWKI